MSSLPSFDRRLVGRIKKYMSEHRRVVFDQMAEDLQQLYWRDYGRRKRGAFKNLVKQIHRLVLEEEAGKKNLKDMENHHLAKRRKEDFKASDSSDSEEILEMVESTDNSMNTSIASLYKKQRKSISTPSSPFRYVDCPTPKSTTSEPENQIIGEIDKTPILSTENDEIEIKRENLNFQPAESILSTEKLVNGDKISSNFINMNGRMEEIITNTPEREVKSEIQSKKLRKNKKNPRNKDADAETSSKEAKSTFTLQASNVKFDDIGGNEKTLREVCKLLIHIRHPEIYKTLGVIPPCGVLLHGPPGCGKSLLANAIAGELGLPMMKLAATEIVSGVSGESEQKLRDVFEIALTSAPCIIFIDEIDSITPKREIASKDMERRIVAQLLSCLDDLNKSPSQILVIGATNRPDAIDPALRRAGRFDREICMGIPDEKAREDILRVLCKNLKLETEFKYSMLARLTPGYVGADLMSLCREAAMCAFNRILATMRNQNSSAAPSVENSDTPNKDLSQTTTENSQKDESNLCTDNAISVDDDASEDMVSEPSISPTNQVQPLGGGVEDIILELSTAELLTWLRETTPLTEEQLDGLSLCFPDFEQALPLVQPSAKREGFATVPDVTWDDVGALEGVRDELTVAVLGPVRNPAAFAALGLTKPPGILLAGPPGCGKTLLAKAIANESGINFISVKGPELLNMYVGESERAVRQCFERARNSAPCVVFFDELDSLCPRRSGSENSSTARVVNQMLTEMDGLETRGHVFVMAATNRPDIIDPAVLRPGRLDKTLYVGLPGTDDRLKILQTITKNGTKPPISPEVSLEVIAKDEKCMRFTGADLSSLVREAAVNALRDHISKDHVFEKDTPLAATKIILKMEHFEKAFKKVRPSVSVKDELKYEKMKFELQN